MGFLKNVLFNSSAAQPWCLIYPKHQRGRCTSWQIKKKIWLCKALFVLLIWSITQWERHLYEYESGTLLCTHCNLVSISALAVPHWLDYTTTSPRAFLFFCTNLLQQPQPAHSECTPLSLYLLYTRSQDQCFFFLSHNSAAV